MFLRGWLCRQMHSRNLGLQRKPGILLEHWQQELRMDAAFVIAHLLQQREPLTFLQVGAFDGSANDVLSGFVRRGKLRGVLVEPQPHAFAALQQSYRDVPGLSFERAAIGPADGEAGFYRVREEFADLCPRACQLSGFSPDVILKCYRNLVPRPEDVLETVKVPTLTFRSLLAKHGLAQVDVLQIDAEGYDFRLLSLFDFNQMTPAVVNFEVAHLSESDRTAAYRLLLRHGYFLAEHGWDCIGYHRSAVAAPPFSAEGGAGGGKRWRPPEAVRGCDGR
jgi:FkbM family methyltransferase